MLGVLALLLAVAAALHADEVGQRDWHVPLVGRVDSAVVLDGTTLVAGPRGYLAAIGGSGDLRWRLAVATTAGDQVLSILPPTRRVRHLTVVTKRRLVYAIEPTTGAVTATATVGLFGTARTLMGCNTPDATTLSCLEVEDGQPFRVTYDTARMESSDEGYSTIEATTKLELPHGEGVKDASVHRHHAWMVTVGASLVHVDLRNATATTIAGNVTQIVSVASAMAIFEGADGLRTVAIKPGGVDAGHEPLPPRQAIALGSGAVASLQHAALGPILSMVTPSGVENFDIAIPSLYNRQPTLVAARADSSGVLTGILRAYNDDLVAVRVNSNEDTSARVVWTRLEGLASPAQALLADDAVDKFGFNRSLYVVSVFGTVYTRHVLGSAFTAVGCFSSASPPESHYSHLEVRGGVVSVTAQSSTEARRLSLGADGSAAIVWSVNEPPLVSLSDCALRRDLTLVGEPPAASFFTWYANVTSGSMNGVLVGTDGTVRPRWSMRLGGPIAHMATLGHDGEHESNANIRHIRNATGVGLIYHKYRMKHIVVLGQYVHSALRLTAVDTITGSVVAAQELIGVVPNSASVTIAEHAVVVPFTSVADARSYVLTWELFETEDRVTTDGMMATPAGVVASLLTSWKERPRSSAFTTRAPTVVATRRPLLVGQVRSVGVSSSLFGAARRLVLFATTRGHIYTVELSSLLSDSAGVVNPQKPEEPPIDAVGAPATSIASHHYDVMGVRHIIASPTQLESSCHVVAVGLDVFYVRVSAGKAFDTLNSDFNTPLVWGITAACMALTVVLRLIARQKRIRSAWA